MFMNKTIEINWLVKEYSKEGISEFIFISSVQKKEFQQHHPEGEISALWPSRKTFNDYCRALINSWQNLQLKCPAVICALLKFSHEPHQCIDFLLHPAAFKFCQYQPFCQYQRQLVSYAPLFSQIVLLSISSKTLFSFSSNSKASSTQLMDLPLSSSWELVAVIFSSLHVSFGRHSIL